MYKEIVIDKKFCGPTESGQGGYVSGLLGGIIDGVAEVTLKTPPPLEKALMIDMTDNNCVKLLDGEAVVAEAQPISLELAVPDPPTYDEAVSASKNYIGFKQHAFPKCYVCGPERLVGDGLRIFPGLVVGKDIVAAPWIPDISIADENGNVKNEFIWASLDCTGAFAVLTLKLRVIVLGKLAVAIEGKIKAGERYIVTGWTIGVEGRKLHAGTAVFSESGKLCAKARATWIDLNKVQ